MQAKDNALSTDAIDLSTPPSGLSTPPPGLSTPPLNLSTPPSGLSDELLKELKTLKRRENDKEKIKGLIIKLCSIKPLKSSEIANFLNKREDYIKRKFLRAMIGAKELKYLHPEMLNHPEQAYLTNKND